MVYVLGLMSCMIVTRIWRPGEVLINWSAKMVAWIVGISWFLIDVSELWGCLVLSWVTTWDKAASIALCSQVALPATVDSPEMDGMDFGQYPDCEDDFVIKLGIGHHPMELFHPLYVYSGEHGA